MLDIGREGVGISVAIYKNKGLIFFLAHARTWIRCPEAAVFCRPKCANMFHFVRACMYTRWYRCFQESI